MKKVEFGASRPSKRQPPADVDAWVKGTAGATKEQTKRLTIDVPIGLHRRIKSQCALDNLVMAEEIRDLLEQRFPATHDVAGRGS